VASRTLADLRLATLVGDVHLECMSGVCAAVDVRDQEWRAGAEDGPPDLLLIESTGLCEPGDGGERISDRRVERATELVARGKSEQVPTVLWETRLNDRIDTPVSLMEDIDHLFVADPDAAAPVSEKVEGKRPMQLPLAAQVVPKDPPPFDQRRHMVGFGGSWPPEFKGRVRDELEAILDEAVAHGLTIFRPEHGADLGALPDRFASSVVSAGTGRDAIEGFQECRVVVGFDPGNDGRLMVPQLAFDGFASGAAVIGPNHTGIRRMFRYSMSVATTREEAADALGRILGEEHEWTIASRPARRAILHAHTYSHRLATIASAARFRLLPISRQGPGTSS
jgi:Glycosyl transferases group 1